MLAEVISAHHNGEKMAVGKHSRSCRSGPAEDRPG